VRSRTCESDVRTTRAATLLRCSERVKDTNVFKSTRGSNHAGGAVVVSSMASKFYNRLQPLTGLERGKWGTQKRENPEKIGVFYY
jgi:hypothetical protein